MTREDDFISPVKDVDYWEFGLSKLEYFSAMAMQGLLAGDVGATRTPPGVVASHAVDLARYLIVELNRDS